MKFEFIHCGDIHLGCFPNRLEERFLDFFNAFNDVIKYAVTNQIKLVLVSGDLFHLKVINSKTLQKTIDILQLAKENEIDVIVIEGNHDKAFYIDEDSWLVFLNSQKYIKLLQSEFIDGKLILTDYEGSRGSIIETNDYRIIGLGYMGGTTERYVNEIGDQVKPSTKFTILMMHAAINRLSGQDMGDIKGNAMLDLKRVIDYVALGHIHNRYDFASFCYNPGSLENIRLRDGITSEKKGFYHVKVNDDKSKEVIHIPSSPRKVNIESLNVTGFKNPNDVEKNILTKEFSLSSNEMMELNLYGQVDFNPYLIDVNDICCQLKNKYNLLHIEINNNINIIKGEEQSNEVVDMKSIVETLIKKDIAFNFPNVKEIDEVAKAMIEVSDMLTEGYDEETIIENLLKQDVKI
jgi:DNA repair exonuclease SbcCD nuclease subunit